MLNFISGLRLVVAAEEIAGERVVEVYAGEGHLVAAVLFAEPEAVFGLFREIAEELSDGDVLLVTDVRRVAEGPEELGLREIPYSGVNPRIELMELGEHVLGGL